MAERLLARFLRVCGCQLAQRRHSGVRGILSFAVLVASFWLGDVMILSHVLSFLLVVVVTTYLDLEIADAESH